MLGKLKPLSGQEVCRILAAYGFVPVRRRGSHVIVQKQEAGETVTIPVPGAGVCAAGEDGAHGG